VDELATHPAMKSYHLLDSVRGDFLEKLGLHDQARAAFERAADLAQNAREKALLQARAQAVSRPSSR
jgi:predicted RNA polymerase sigma factor